MVRWQGASGGWYIHSVYGMDEELPFESGNLVLVCPDGRGGFEPVWVDAFGPDQGRPNLRRLTAVHAGVTQAHVHVLAKTAEERERITRDIQARYFGEIPRTQVSSAA